MHARRCHPGPDVSTFRKILSLHGLRALFGPPGALSEQRRASFAEGLQAFAPAMVATAAWALVTGVATVKMGLAPAYALAMSAFVYAGSAQLAALPLIAAGAPIWLILLTASIVNLRFVIFSAGLYPYFRSLTLWRRLMLGYLTTDLGYLLAMRRWPQVPTGAPASIHRNWFFLGLSAGNWIAWQSMSVAGVLLADRIPAGWGLDFVGILALIAILVPSISDAPSIIAATVAATVAILAQPLPLKLAVLAAVVAGVAAAIVAERALPPSGAGT
jgi:predicted branched-subunit amino acid permease